MITDSNNISEQFIHFLIQHCHCTGNESFLLAVSGGVDSMVMLDLFIRNKFDIAVAHCNFCLRGKESDGDEEFVRQVADITGVRIFMNKFDTLQYAEDKGISIQMAARDLRYQWFNELMRDRDIDLTAMAHHKDDSVETFMINLSRGTGITGLTGIKPRTGNIIRPLLFLTREEIRFYAESLKIRWREDSSNNTVKYLRNKIRHMILPDISKVLPGFAEAVIKTMTQLQETKDLLNTATNQFMKEAVTMTGRQIKIKIANIREIPSSRIILYEVLQKYGFNYDACNRLMEAIKGQPGKQFFSRTHELTIDRSLLIIQPLMQRDEEETEIPPDTVTIQFPVNLTLRIIHDPASHKIPHDNAIASFDMKAIQFPLKIRKWKKGDLFYPLGMKKRKKLSDFFINEKIALPDKKRIWLLESSGNIVWIIGLRIDDRYKVTRDTENILEITYHPGFDE
ncbi:MAG: tRNA lysidine(34) synthetase TilS [Bacteroidales bacterium]|nr:tRNA lysidine(34) synthetase TilS [Bacteroidales bacterium]